MKTAQDYYEIAYLTWLVEMVFLSKESYVAADMAGLSIAMILEGRF